MNNQHSITIIPNEQRHAMLNSISDIALECNGILFGEIVRNYIIKQEYTNKYLNKNKETTIIDFWTYENDLDTLPRCILPANVDVYFSKDIDYHNFLNNLRNNKFNVKYGNTNNDNIIFQQILYASFKIGSSFVNEGIILEIPINAWYNQEYGDFNKIEPPFNNPDILCNLFIRKKNELPRLSNNTGTQIDTFSIFEKKQAEVNIIKMMLKFTTHIISCDNIQNLICKISKMLYNEHFKWNIENLPFITGKFNEIKKDDDTIMEEDTCCICISNYIEDNNVAVITRNDKKKFRTFYHKNCLIKHMEAKASDIMNENYECQCPLRTLIDFTKINKFNYNDLKS